MKIKSNVYCEQSKSESYVKTGSKSISAKLPSPRKGIKILTTKQMVQRLPIALGQVKSSNASKNLPQNTSIHQKSYIKR